MLPEYRYLDRINHQQRLALVLVLLLCAGFSASRHWGGVVLALAGWGGLYFFLLTKKKSCVARIGTYFIGQDFPPEVLAKTTLYQIGEFYHDKCKILSLVDAIYHLDKVYRFSLLFSFLLVAYIVDIKIWSIKQISFVLFYVAIVLLVNSSFIYKRFK